MKGDLAPRPAALPAVLAYHKVARFELGGNWMPPGRFERQIDALRAAGWRFIDETAFLASLDGERSAAGPEVLLTFDDGYEVLRERALPFLESRGIPALIFVPTAFIGGENRWDLYWPGRRFRHLGWEDIRRLAGGLFSFGSHGRTHRDLTRLAPEDFRCELVRSKEELESGLGAPVRCLSYPFGRADRRIADEAARAGYRAAFSLYPPGPPRAEPDRYALPREGIYVIDTARTISWKLGRGPLRRWERAKGRAINAVSVLTPLFKRGS